MKLILFSSFFASLGAYNAFAKDIIVEMKSISFSPKAVELQAGDAIVWKNVSLTDHDAVGEKFDSGTIEPKKESKPLKFDQPGTYAYNCKIHGKTMSGTINVSAK